VSASLRRRATAEVPVSLPGARSSRETRSRGCAALPDQVSNSGNPSASGRPRLAETPGRMCSQTGRNADRGTSSRNGPNDRRCSAPKVTEAAGRLRGTNSVPASGTPCRAIGSRQSARDRGASNCPRPVKCPRTNSRARGVTPIVDATLSRHEASIVCPRRAMPLAYGNPSAAGRSFQAAPFCSAAFLPRCPSRAGSRPGPAQPAAR
jgi:hypothetical protein